MLGLFFHLRILINVADSYEYSISKLIPVTGESTHPSG
jgi:hypothetical protein